MNAHDHLSVLRLGILVAIVLVTAGCANSATAITQRAGTFASPSSAAQTPTGIPDNQTTPPVGATASITIVTASPTAVPTLSEIPTVPPTPSDYPGISYAQPTALPVVSEEQAIDIARLAPGTPAEMSKLPREQFSAVYVLLTDENVHVTNDLGTPVARNEPVWIVTAHGLTTIPGPSIPGQTSVSSYATNSEMEVVIDAVTGDWVATNTYK